MMKRVMTYLLIVLLIPALFSCEGETRYTKTIENLTEYDISLIIYHHTSSAFPNDTISIPAGETYTFVDDSMLGGQSEEMNPMEGADSVKYVAPPGIFVDFDIMSPENWTSSVEQVSGIPSVWKHSYTFKLKSESIWVVKRLNTKDNSAV